jgi:hypothetical protein
MPAKGMCSLTPFIPEKNKQRNKFTSKLSCELYIASFVAGELDD